MTGGSISDSTDKGKPISFMHIGPAISPLFGNNPGFGIVQYDPAAFLFKDYSIYWLNLEATTPVTEPWKLEYTFSSKYSSVYQNGVIDPATIKALYDAIKTDQTVRANYIKYYNVSDPLFPGITDADWEYFRCAIGNWTKADFEKCKSADSQASDSQASDN